MQNRFAGSQSSRHKKLLEMVFNPGSWGTVGRGHIRTLYGRIGAMVHLRIKLELPLGWLSLRCSMMMLMLMMMM